ncbi:hypothetical protein HCH52_11080 [Oscillospiraceae bacterium HV4-5-C5C]|nr:hypothetical protein [Oscillospiraceae bacterium HV4-5-C5C]
MLNFALIADTHYAPRTEENNRFYSRSLDKINACLPLLQKARPAFLMHLGDVVDVPHDPVGALDGAQKIWSAMQMLQVPVLLTAGNHDIDSLDQSSWLHLTGAPGQRGPGFCYAWTQAGHRLIVLDCLSQPDGRPYTPGTMRWKALWVSPPAQAWLTQELAASRDQPVILFCHALLDDLDSPYVVCNAAEIRHVLRSYANIVAVFQGHKHDGQISFIHGLPFLTVPAMVETPERATCWQVSSDGRRLTVRRYTLSGSRILQSDLTVLN